MARLANPNSVRQRAFRMLDEMKKVKRENALKVLMDTFNIGNSYAATIHATWRTINKESGVMIKVYSVRDMRDGKATSPYMKVENVFEPQSDACLNPVLAKEQYELGLKNKIALSKEL